MADDADVSQARMEREQALRERAPAERPYRMPFGPPGECDFCGEYSVRLVSGACAPCRDRRGLP